MPLKITLFNHHIKTAGVRAETHIQMKINITVVLLLTYPYEFR